MEYEKSGGVIHELLVHEIDWMVDIAGLPKTVYCRTASRFHDHPRANEHIWLTFAFGDEVTGTIEGSQMADIADYYKGIIGTTGSICHRNWGSEVRVKESGKDARTVDLVEPFDKHSHFLDVIEGDIECLIDAHWGRTIVHIADQALNSALRGEIVAL